MNANRILLAAFLSLLTTTILSPTARAKDLEIVIDSVPTGARVEMNGNTIGTTPLRRMYPKTYFDTPNTVFSKYLGESVTLTFIKEGFSTKSVEITHGPFLWRSLNGVNTFLYYLLERNYSVHLESNEPETPSSSPSGSRIASYGTAFHVFAPGYLITNFHVVDGARSITVERNRARCAARVVASDKYNDLAVLQIESSCRTLLDLGTPLQLGASALTAVGADVVTYGYALPQEFGAAPQASKGIIKSMSGLEADPRTLTISNALQPGNSGGPLLTNDGNVVGVVTATMNVNYLYPRYNALPQDLNFAVKSEYVNLLFEVSGIAGQSKLLDPAAIPDKSSSTGSQALLELVEENLVLISTSDIE